jgi:hypothetical protein
MESIKAITEFLNKYWILGWMWIAEHPKTTLGIAVGAILYSILS